MKKFLVMLLSIIMTISLYACSVSDKEKAASMFISSYYAQYENKEEIKDLLNSANPPAEIEAFISDNFINQLTEKGKIALISNRILPKFDVLESQITKAEADDYSFSEADNEIEGTLRFSAKVSFRYEDGSSSEKVVTGLIRIENENGRYLVDGFKFIED